MATNDVIRSWKDPAFRSSLPVEERDLLPPSPLEPVALPWQAGAAATDCSTTMGYLTQFCCPDSWDCPTIQ